MSNKQIQDRNLYFDIETAPLSEDRIREFLPNNITPPKTYKTPEAQERYIAEKIGEFIANAALSPLTGRVCAIGFAFGNSKVDFLIDKDGEEERGILQGFWSFLNDTCLCEYMTRANMTRSRAIGFNSNEFDIPFLVRRSWILGVKIPDQVLINIKGRFYLSDSFVDVMQYWACGTMQKISLNNVAKALNVGEKNGNGANFYQTLIKDEAKALEYLSNDVNMTRACARKLGLDRI